MRSNQSKVFGFFVVIITAAISVPVIGDGFIIGSWVLWIDKYQTLIAGVFAIIAALITVRAMRISDDKQEKRHQDIRKMELRHDAARIRRFVNIHIPKMENSMYIFMHYYNETYSKTYAEKVCIINQQSYKRIVDAADKLSNVFMNEYYDDTKYLLGSISVMSIERVISYIAHLNKFSNDFPPRFPNNEVMQLEFLADLDEFIALTYAMYVELQKAINDIRDLLSEYE